MSGVFYLVGVGPGDPELLSLKAARILGAIDVVAYGQKPGTSSLALSIARTHINPKAIHIPADIPMLVERAPAQAAYDELADRIRVRLRAGKNLAYLCQGDPLFYGSAIYLLERLGTETEVRIIPGINSLGAAMAASGLALTMRNDVLKILPAPLANARLGPELERAEAAAIIKLGRHFARIRALLVATGLAAGALVVEHASTEKQKITPLLEFKKDQVPYFSLVLCSRERGR